MKTVDDYGGFSANGVGIGSPFGLILKGVGNGSPSQRVLKGVGRDSPLGLMNSWLEMNRTALKIAVATKTRAQLVINLLIFKNFHLLHFLGEGKAIVGSH